MLRRACSRVLFTHQKRCLSTSTVLFPNERYGVDYGANWAAASCGVVASEDKLAFRNPSIKTLSSFYKSSWVDKKAKVMGREATETDLFPSVEEVTFEEIEAVAKQAASSGSGAAFVIDGGAGVGSNAINVRGVSDDPSFALLLQTILCPTPKRDPQDFIPAVHLVHSQIADDAASKPYCAVSNDRIVARGNVSTAALTQALAHAAAKAVCGETSLAVKGQIFTKGSEVTLVLGDGTKKTAVKGAEVASTHSALWTSNGLSRMWNAEVKSSSEVIPNTVVETAFGHVIAPLAYKLPNILPHPSTIIFSGSKKGAEELVSLFPTCGSLLGSEEELAAFEKLVELSKAKLKAQ